MESSFESNPAPNKLLQADLRSRFALAPAAERRRSRSLSLGLYILIWVLTAASTVRADAIDMYSYLSRVNAQSHTPLVAILLMVALFGLNYVLNFAVIGVAAIRGGVPVHSVASGLVAFTVLGQLADRIGAVLSLPLLAPVLFGNTETSVLLLFVASNLFFAGLAIGLLAYHFLHRRWKIAEGRSFAISIAAALLTNPAWSILLFN